MAKNYTFDEVNHIHKIGDVIVPGITTIIKPLTNYECVPEHLMKQACLYGSSVHKMVELFCMDNLDVEGLDPSLQPSLAGFQTWLKEYKLEPSDFIVEVPMCDPALMVACIPDLILDGKLIVELKTRKPNLLTDSIQTVCQEHVWKKNGGAQTKEYDRFVLYLAQDGSYTYTKVNDKQANGRFRLLLDHYWNSKTIASWEK